MADIDEAIQSSNALRDGHPTAGLSLPDWILPVDATTVIAGALATRDLYPVHHDVLAAKAQGLPDIILNVCTIEAYLARYVTDWASPHVVLTGLRFTIHTPTFPGDQLHFTGRVGPSAVDGEWTIDVRAAHSRGLAFAGAVSVR